MIKEMVQELVTSFEMSAGTAKSLTNRLESAFTKQGTVSQLFNSVHSSLNKQAEGITDENERLLIEALARVFAIGNELAKQAKESVKQAKKPVWADSQEEALAIAQTIKPAKPSAKAQRATLNEMSKKEQADLIAQLLEMVRG